MLHNPRAQGGRGLPGRELEDLSMNSEVPNLKMTTTRKKREVVKELTPENPVRRSSRHTLAPKRLEYSPEEPVKTPQKKRRKSVVQNETTPKRSKSSEPNNDMGLSAYELERLENIRKNQEFLSSLNILEIITGSQNCLSFAGTEELKQSVRRKPTHKGLQSIPLRRSNRLQNIEVQQLDMSKIPTDLLSMPLKKPPGPYLMNPVNMTESHLPEQLLEIWNETSSAWGDDGVLLFEPHSSPISCIAFSLANPTHLLSTSYDGSMRSMDVQKAVFDDVYDVEDGLRTFDFLSHDGMSLVVGTSFGDLAVVDRRTPGNTHESLHTLDTKIVRCVNVHPLQKQYIAVAESKVVSIYDIRLMKKHNSTPVCQLMGHSKSITSAYFSPDSGNRILTSCMDDCIRIYDTSATNSAPLLKAIRHNMQTGRWLTKLSATWDPKQENCFVVGCVSKPRCVQVFHESGLLLHTFSDMENLTTVLSALAFHPTRNVLMGGNASGRLHVFT
ncbi:hypothetical protein WMY93_013854 [Mugilogobius chulae]|uniref:WD repeat-containing protein 76 n=1 Tax=Mugilogobius chulae TaxID=88201 RepID=A0AAW0P2Q3_9GOBI